MKPCGLILQRAQLLLCQDQLLASVPQLPHQLVIRLLQLHVLHLGLVLLTVKLLALMLQLETKLKKDYN